MSKKLESDAVIEGVLCCGVISKGDVEYITGTGLGDGFENRGEICIVCIGMNGPSGEATQLNTKAGAGAAPNGLKLDGKGKAGELNTCGI